MSLGGAAVVLERDLLNYRRTWRGSLIVSFISPVLFLAAMGLGLGSLISHGQHRLVEGVPYLDYLAPGLLAATAMQTAALESMYPILAKMMWDKIYDSILATPVQVREVFLGEIAWLVVRVAIVTVAFFSVMVLFSAVHSPLGLLAVPLDALPLGDGCVGDTLAIHVRTTLAELLSSAGVEDAKADISGLSSALLATLPPCAMNPCITSKAARRHCRSMISCRRRSCSRPTASTC